VLSQATYKHLMRRFYQQQVLSIVAEVSSAVLSLSQAEVDVEDHLEQVAPCPWWCRGCHMQMAQGSTWCRHVTLGDSPLVPVVLAASQLLGGWLAVQFC
jgi:putative copper export protein